MPRVAANEEPPAWMLDVAHRVAQVVHRPSGRDRFQAMLSRWCREPQRGDQGVVRLPTKRELTEPEIYAVLAAIHDHVYEDAKRIDLWGIHRRAKSFSRLKAGMRYAVLVRDRIAGLLPEDVPQINEWLRRVGAKPIDLTRLQSTSADRVIRHEKIRRVSISVAIAPNVDPDDSRRGERLVSEASTSGDDERAGYHSADTLMHQHGMRPQRLSAAAGAGEVRTKPAPRGTLDSQGRRVRTLYHEQDALKHCQPKRVTKRVTKRTLGKLGLRTS